MNRLYNFLAAKVERGTAFNKNRFPKIFAGKNFKKADYQIQIVGTNGKGSTGRFLACGLNNSGKNVFHFTSPHVDKINERFWLNGQIAKDDELFLAHNAVFETLSKDEKAEISYFEYCTLLAAYFAQNCDVAIFEAGLGGEFDSTSALDIDLTLCASIDYDHMEILGNSIEQIALTKLKAVQKTLIIGKQNFETEVFKTLNLLNPKITIYDYKAWLRADDDYLAKQVCDALNIWASPFINNALLAISAMRYLNVEPQLESFKKFDLKARAQKINDYIWIDVGHNPSAAKALSLNFAPKSMRLVFGCANDKDGEGILKELACITTHVEFFNYDSTRKTDGAKLRNYAKSANLTVQTYEKDSKAPTLVFGSFELINAFLGSLDV